jgi:hypothetical protein
MDTIWLERLRTALGTDSNRRRALAGVSGVALSAVGVLRLTTEVAADARRRCIDRCVSRGGSNQLRQRRKRCRRKCANR